MKQISDVSSKIEKFILNAPPASLELPTVSYGPFCLKILSEFISYHKLNPNLPLPQVSMDIRKCLSLIFDVMLHSMGETKRKEILLELDDYKNSIYIEEKNESNP